MSQDPFILSSAQAHEIEIAMNRSQNGPWSPELVHLLTKGNQLGQFRQVLLGLASITVVSHVIDCDADPFVPDDWSVKEHQKGGSWKWDSSNVTLWLADGQKNGKFVGGSKLRKELARKPVLNANVLDYLLMYTGLIPEEWKRKYSHFWGTVYRDRDGFLYVRYLYWKGDRWHSRYRWLGSDLNDNDPALVRTS